MIKGKKILSNLLILLFAIIFCLITIELFIRVFFPQQLIYLKSNIIWQPVDGLGWKNSPNLYTKINTGEKTVLFKTDDNGFRVGNKRIESPQYKLLALGDSFVAAMQVEYEESVTGKLESILAQRLGKEIQIVNTGVGGWSPGQYLRQAKIELEKNQYDLVLVFLYIANDIVIEHQDHFPLVRPAEKHLFSWPRNFSRTEFINSIIYPINDILENNSALFIFLKNKFAVLRMRVGFTAEYLSDALLKSEADSPGYKIAADISLGIKKVAQDHGAKTVFVLIPAPYQVDDNFYKQYVWGFNVDPSTIDINLPNQIFKKELEKRNLFVFDPVLELREESKNGNKLYGSVDSHFNSNGHAALAKALAPILEDILRH